MDYMPCEEKRRAFRLKRNLPIHCELRSEGKYVNTLTRDISEGGVKIITDSFIPRLSRMTLCINMADGKLIETNGEVKWMNRIPYSYRYRLGLEFRDIDAKVKSDIAKYVAINR